MLDQAFVIGAFRSATLPTATGGVGPYTYSFTCAGGALPSGVGFAPATRVLAGTADAVFRDSCTYTVTDSSRPAATASQDLEVTSAAARYLALPPVPDLAFFIGTFRSATLPTATGGVGPYTYSFTCAGGALPPGMGFEARTRRFAGTPTTRFRDSCTYTVTDSTRPAETVARAVEVEVRGVATPLSLASPGKQSLVVGDFLDEAFAEATGGVAPYTYSFTCAGGALPPGMGFEARTRRFAGTPTTRFRDSCTYTVTDSTRPAETVALAVEVEVRGGAVPLELTHVFENRPDDDELPLYIGRRSKTMFQAASGGVAPYTYELDDCTLPEGLAFSPGTRILSGTPDEEYRGPICTYRVTDSLGASVSLPFVLTVSLREEGDWRFRTRTVEPGGPCALPGDGSVEVAILPRAHRREGATSEARYALSEVPHSPEANAILSFDGSSRVLKYANPDTSPVLGTPDTYRYLVGTADPVNVKNAEDVLCLDIQYRPRSRSCDEEAPLTHIQILLHVRDDAFWDENAGEYRCPDTTAPPPRQGARGSLSNPVHEALGPVHARRATALAHAAVRDRVRKWSPGPEQASFAITPEVGLASLSGQSEGFDYSGTSASASFGAETGAGAWQAGLIASLTRTELHYRAEAALAERGYRTGEHDTEILSVHPFAAWHAPSGGHLWASLGAGAGDLRHHDDLGFPSWSRSDVSLRAWTAGLSVPVAQVLSGDLDAEAGIESFAFEIEGGGQISAALPTLRGRDWRAGLAWSAPVAGTPSLSLAWRQSTGDGPESARVEARGSVSAAGVLDPRLSLTGSALASLGLGDSEHSSWGLGGGVRFAPNGRRRGFGLDLDTRLASPADDRSAGLRLRGEAGYGLSGGPLLGTVRPYVKMIRHSDDRSFRRILGLDLRDTPSTSLKVEARAHSRDRSSAITFSIRHRF